MRDSSGIVGLECPNCFPALADDADGSIAATKKETVGSGADAGYFVGVEQATGFVIGEGDLGDFEEVEGLPLEGVSSSVGQVAGSRPRDWVDGSASATREAKDTYRNCHVDASDD